MKQIITAIVILLSIACATQKKQPAQQSQVVATVDIINKTNDYCPTCLKKDKCYTVRLINLNPLLFDIKVSTDNRPIVVNAEDNIIQQLVTGLNKTTENSVSNPDAAAPKEEIANEIATSKGLKPKTKERTAIENKSDAFIQAYNDYKQTVVMFKMAVADINKIVNFCNEVTGYCYDPLSDQGVITGNITASAEIRDYIRAGLANSTPNEPLLVSKATGLSVQLKNRHDACVSAHQTLIIAYERLKEESVNIPVEAVNMMESSIRSLAEIKSVLDKFKTADLSALASKTGKAYTIVHNPNSFERNVSIYCGDFDSVLTKVELIPLDKNTIVPGISPMSFNTMIKGSVKTFTAAALILNFFGVRDDKYFLDSDTIVRRAGRRNAAFPSLAIMQTFYKENCAATNWGLSIGLTANLNNLTSLSDLRFFLGPSFIIRNKSKFLISAGLTGGFAEKLKGVFEKDKSTTPELLTSENNVLTDKAFRFGGYVGFAIKIL